MICVNFVAAKSGPVQSPIEIKSYIKVENTENKTRNHRPLWMRLLIHLGIMAVVVVVVAWGAMMWLDSWTGHGTVVNVPSVKGLPYSEAVEKLKSENLVVELADSVYDTGSAAGTVLEQNPKVDTKVKPGRAVFLTINAFSPKTVTIPTLNDISLRQARSILEGLGIRNIRERRVPSEFKDLVLDVKYNGVRLAPGARIPVNGTVELEVGEGLPEFNDSIDADSATVSAQSEQLDLF